MRANGLFCASRLLTPMIRAVYLDQARRYSAAQPKKRCKKASAISTHFSTSMRRQ